MQDRSSDAGFIGPVAHQPANPATHRIAPPFQHHSVDPNHRPGRRDCLPPVRMDMAASAELHYCRRSFNFSHLTSLLVPLAYCAAVQAQPRSRSAVGACACVLVATSRPRQAWAHLRVRPSTTLPARPSIVVADDHADGIDPSPAMLYVCGRGTENFMVGYSCDA